MTEPVPVRLIVGLGNIGPEYEQTRHNAGFWFVDEIAARHGGTFNREARFFGEVARVRIGPAQVWLLKPGTYMNESGRAVAALAGFHRIEPAQTLVVHDELDLAPGVVRLKRGGGNAGHNGLKDIAARFGADTLRLRIGIGHPRDANLRQQVADYVLTRPRAAERQAIEDALPPAWDAIERIVAGDVSGAMQALHAPPGRPA